MSLLDKPIQKVAGFLFGPPAIDPPNRPEVSARTMPEEPQAHRLGFRPPSSVIDLSMPLDTIAPQTEAALDRIRPRYDYEGDE